MNVNKHLFCCMLFQLFCFTASFFNKDVMKKNIFFRKDYIFIEATQSFFKVHSTSRTWYEARKRCAIEGASLWHPEDQGEVNIIMNYWKEKFPKKTKLHIGLSDLLSKGYWETVDGKYVDYVWHNWVEREPITAVENCVAISRNTSIPLGADMKSENCTSHLPFICKKTLASLDWNHVCDVPDKKYIYEHKLGKCYKFHKKITTWTEAYSVCAAEGSYLAVINSEDEKDFLVKMTTEAEIDKIPWNFWDIRQVHVGFHRRFGDNWQTVTGQPLHESGYLVWAPGQPDNLGNEECGSMFPTGAYNDYKCTKMAFSICEHDIGFLGNAIDERLGYNY